MNDLISIQAAIDALGERPDVWMDSDYEIAQRNQYDADLLAIETVPSADVVEVVYCSECKYWNELLGICQRRQKLYGYGVHDYCSKAERRTDAP